MSTVFVERKLFAIAPNGEELDISLRVSVPMPDPQGDWSVEVCLPNLDDFPCKLFGVDSWQAGILGIQFVKNRVDHFSEIGWQFFWAKGGEKASMDDLQDDG